MSQPADRAQIRLDAETTLEMEPVTQPEQILARHCLALLAEREQAEKEFEQAKRDCNANALALADAKKEADRRERTAVLEGERRIDSLEAKLAKVPPLVEALKELEDAADSVHVDPEGSVGFDDLEVAIGKAREALAAWNENEGGE
jgi:hypothetical protein